MLYRPAGIFFGNCVEFCSTRVYRSGQFYPRRTYSIRLTSNRYINFLSRCRWIDVNGLEFLHRTHRFARVAFYYLLSTKKYDISCYHFPGKNSQLDQREPALYYRNGENEKPTARDRNQTFARNSSDSVRRGAEKIHLQSFQFPNRVA